MNETRGGVLRYSEPVVWTAVLIGIPAWIAHLVFEASMVGFTSAHPGWRWTLHLATGGAALVTLAGMAICFDLIRLADRSGPGDVERDDASSSTLTRFLGEFGLLLGATNLVLILLEGSYVIFVRRGG
jgi:hypothetical protein